MNECRIQRKKKQRQGNNGESLIDTDHKQTNAIFKSFILTWRACWLACRQGHCVHVYISELIR